MAAALRRFTAEEVKATKTCVKILKVAEPDVLARSALTTPRVGSSIHATWTRLAITEAE